MDLPSWYPTVIAALGVTLLFWRRWIREEQERAANQPSKRKVVEIRDDPDKPIAFGAKSSWIATRAPDAEALAAALGLVETQPCNWASGFLASRAYPSDYVFVTPRIGDWVLATGIGLPEPSNPSLDDWRSLMARVSRHFGEAQYFASHRVSSYSAWSLYDKGRETRLFACADDPIHNLGEPLPEEADLMAHLPNLEEADEDSGYWDREDLRVPQEEDVLRLAAAWSFDPSTLDSLDLPPSLGLVGRWAPDTSAEPES